jgi:hypothetical protein
MSTCYRAFIGCPEALAGDVHHMRFDEGVSLPLDAGVDSPSGRLVFLWPPMVATCQDLSMPYHSIVSNTLPEAISFI